MTKTKTKGIKKTTAQQTLHIVTWLGIPASFKLITGSAAQGSVVAGSKLKKTDAYKALSKYMKKEAAVEWDTDSCKKRYESMMKKYKATKAAYEDVGGAKFCLSEKELAEGLTIDEKIARECPGYFRLDILYGNRQNVNPASIFETNIDEDSASDQQDTGSSSDEEGEEGDEADEADVASNDLFPIAACENGDRVNFGDDNLSSTEKAKKKLIRPRKKVKTLPAYPLILTKNCLILERIRIKKGPLWKFGWIKTIRNLRCKRSYVRATWQCKKKSVKLVLFLS